MDLGPRLPGLYILDGKTAVRCNDLIAWATWMGRARQDDRLRVACDTVGEQWISTVFLGLDHSHGFGHKRLLFETMVFGGPADSIQQRYTTWTEAEHGHKKLLADLLAARDLMQAVTEVKRGRP